LSFSCYNKRENQIKGEEILENIEDIRKITKLALLKIGMRCDFSGFNYLSYAIELVIQNPELINSLCTNLYVKIGEHFGVKNISCVERSMRHAISNIEKKKGFGSLNDMFNANLFEKGSRPTAGELIRLMAEYYNTGLYNEAI